MNKVVESANSSISTAGYKNLRFLNARPLRRHQGGGARARTDHHARGVRGAPQPGLKIFDFKGADLGAAGGGASRLKSSILKDWQQPVGMPTATVSDFLALFLGSMVVTPHGL